MIEESKHEGRDRNAQVGSVSQTSSIHSGKNQYMLSKYAKSGIAGLSILLSDRAVADSQNFKTVKRSYPWGQGMRMKK